MSEAARPVAPLHGPVVDEPVYAPDPLIGIEPTDVYGMITLRGDLGSETLEAAVDEAVGLKVPAALSVVSDGDARVVWMSPDELLLFTDYSEADAAVARISEQMGPAHHMTLNVSDARAVIRLRGARVGEVLSKGAPCDCSDHGFPVGTARRTHMAGLAVAFWRLEPDVWEIVALRSYAHHLLAWLEQAAQPGSEVFA
ncbi:MAG: sarcosine oxidase subunit gamma family protein [Pseudomonadota bacterium]